MATVRVQLTTGSFLSLIKGVSVCDDVVIVVGRKENRIMVRTNHVMMMRIIHRSSSSSLTLSTCHCFSAASSATRCIRCTRGNPGLRACSLDFHRNSRFHIRSAGLYMGEGVDQSERVRSLI